MLRLLQTLEMESTEEDQEDFQLSFLPGGHTPNTPALLVATHPLQHGARVFLFSGTQFTHAGEFTLDTNVLHHAAQWENDKLRFICCQRGQGQPRSLLSLFELSEASQVIREGRVLQATDEISSVPVPLSLTDEEQTVPTSTETCKNQADARSTPTSADSGQRVYTKNSLPDRLKRLIQSRMAKFCGALIQHQEEREKAMRDEIMSSLQVFFENAIQQSVKGHLNTIIDQVTRDMQKTLSAELQKENFMHVLHQEMYDYFSTVMGPAIENSFRAMFQQLNQVFEQGVALHFDTLQEQSTSTNMQGAVDSLNAVCDNIMGEIGTAAMYEEVTDAEFLEEEDGEEDEELDETAALPIEEEEEEVEE